MTTDTENARKTGDARYDDDLPPSRQGSESRVNYSESCGCTGGRHGYVLLIVAALFVLYAAVTILL